MVTDLVTGWQQQLVAGIAAGRKLEPAAVEQILRGGPYLAEEARAKKLIDKLLYYDQYRDLLKSKAGGDKLNTLGLKEYLTRSRAPRGPKIALVHATGAIVTGKSGYDPAIGRYMGSDTGAEGLPGARCRPTRSSPTPAPSPAPSAWSSASSTSKAFTRCWA